MSACMLICIAALLQEIPELAERLLEFNQLGAAGATV